MLARSIPAALLVAGLCALPPVSPNPAIAQGPGQPEEPMTNLQVFPKDTPRGEVIGAMRSFTAALGVRCDHCHVDEADGPGVQDDKASDAKQPKRVAREMMKMTMKINADLLGALPERHDPKVEVSCVTCHHGLPVPETLATRLRATLTASGIDSTMKLYRELREDGLRGRYDFGENALNDLARGLAAESKTADALALLALNREFNPASPMIPMIEAEIRYGAGETDAAIEILRKIVAADPKNGRAARRLKEWESASQKKE